MTINGASSADRGSIWLLEDSPLEAEMARRALSSRHDVTLFADGSTVLERIANSGARPDLLILDWQLAGVSGLETCRVLRETLDEIALPILMLTSYGDKVDIVRALAAGANDYVTKPYDVAELVARVGTLVRTSRFQRDQAMRARQLALAADVGAALTRGRQLDVIAKQCAEAVEKHLQGAAVSIWSVVEGALRPVTVLGSAELFPLSLLEQVVTTRAAAVGGESAGRGAVEMTLRGVRSTIALPLLLGGDLLGVVAVASRQQLGESERHSLQSVADLLALGIARTRAEEARVAALDRERSARADAEAANRSKDEFLAMVSHELRTPLNAITGWTRMLLSGSVEGDRVRRALETIDRNARAQAQLIEDLLDINRIITGRLSLSAGTVDLAATVDMALESLRLAADARGVQLLCDLPADVGTIVGDPDRLQQILWNLVSNAIKFTPRGGQVRIEVTRNDESVRIEVADSGEGIHPDFLPLVFERFRQADTTMRRKKGGLGLGLAIVRHLIELHGGAVSVHSEGVGKGSRFSVVLPVRAERRTPDSRHISRRPDEDRPAELEGLRVLIVDDEPDARELLGALLARCKVIVSEASSAAEALAFLETQETDVIVSDISMPGEDGLALIRKIRASGARTPAIALTALARLEDRTNAVRAGFNGHIPKPVEPSELIAVLASLAPQRNA